MPDEGPVLDPDMSLEAKIAFLKQADAYTERTGKVEAKETHMSWVFLTDAYAYKLKKPVRYPFLDFSTVEARRRNCEAEVRLNRRLAPDVYLGTVALTLNERREPSLDGPGRAVDWLVKMRRLPAERTLEHAIAAGTLKQADFLRVMALLIAFFRHATPVRLDPRAYRRRFERDVRASREELSRPDFRLSQELVRELAAAQLDFLRREGELLEERARSRRIIEGHGDLRPEHIYLGDNPVVVDCLEFNRDFRILDPADELAYLAMECDRLGARFADDWIFGTYKEQTSDAPPRALVDFYKCYRAYLRAKIAVWHLQEPDLAAPGKWMERTMQYLRLARRLSTRLG